ncbi:hypothetical protein EVC45_27540 [Paraburkholderia sp. UYCP14C]|uniref:hypothetical protein n=1 Tax=Paraburkholderia sp. UYCP14C TaxID=2511130 RepID=UPI0010211E06|nr:hypothetical protein [Paraburkholderia sp. UYCP14C]RZF26485.1 hypothetical protein EVC45_27540 [Paraburkholderia sp. UYCP14C]
METIRSTLDEALDLSRKTVSVKEPQEWWTLQSNQFALAAKKAQACNRQLLAPAGSVPVVTALDSALTVANMLYQTLQQAGQQAVEVTRANFDLAASVASKSGKRAIELTTQAVKR